VHGGGDRKNVDDEHQEPVVPGLAQVVPPVEGQPAGEDQVKGAEENRPRPRLALSRRNSRTPPKNAAMSAPTSQQSWRAGRQGLILEPAADRPLGDEEREGPHRPRPVALMKFTFHAAAPNGIRVIIRPSIVYTDSRADAAGPGWRTSR